MAKTNKSRRKRRKAAPHPMSAGPGRQPNGRIRRATTVSERTERCLPTPELAAHLETHGPTDMIQRAVWAKVITDDEARGLEAFAGVRRAIGVAEHNAAGVLGRLAPQSPAREQDEHRLKAALLAYQAACAVLDPIRGAHDACVTICDNRMPHDVDAMKRGARALAWLFIQGQKAAC